MSNDPLVGQRLGNFVIERLLGRGGMSTVYAGWDAKLERPVAIKVIDVSQGDVDFARRLVQEARIIARWKHENIVQVYYADQKSRLYFFAMEHVEGLDLEEVMERYHDEGQFVPHADVIRIGRAIAHALDYAHERDVIHRDVKPSNILLAEDGRILLSDFGLALDVRQGTVGEVLGTPHYVAPEQARDSASTVPESDLYSLGVVLYEILTGTPPFDDPSPMSLALKHITDQPPLPTQINPALTIPIEAVLLKALSKQPEDRYHSGEVLMDALEKALAFNPVKEAQETKPVAELLAEYAASRTTQPTRETGEFERLPVSIKRARRKVASRRVTWQWVGAGIGIIIVASIIGTYVVTSGMLGGQASPPEATSSGLAAATVSSGSEIPTDDGSPTAASGETASAETAAVPTVEVSQPTPTEFFGPSQAGGYRIELFYNQRGFYIYNPDDQAISVGNFLFEALDAATGGPTAYAVSGAYFAEKEIYLQSQRCDILEIVGTQADQTRPPQCNNFNVRRTPSDTESTVFWLPRDGIVEFRVLWEGREIARCPIASGYCEIYLPLAP